MPWSRNDVCSLYWESDGDEHADHRSRPPRRTARPATERACGHWPPAPRGRSGHSTANAASPLPLRGRRRTGTRPLLVVDLVGQRDGQDPRPYHSHNRRRIPRHRTRTLRCPHPLPRSRRHRRAGTHHRDRRRPHRITGAVYRASGWIQVGTTQGRGRYDREKLCVKLRKDMWLRPLRRDWTGILSR